MSEKKLRRTISEGDRVKVTIDGVTKEGVLKDYLSVQYFILYDDGSGAYFFYNEGIDVQKL